MHKKLSAWQKGPGAAREAALQALVRVERDRAYLNLALPAFLKDLPEAERQLARRLAAGTLQHLNTLDWAVGLYSRRSPAAYTPWIRNLLRLGAYQLLYLDRIPPYAAVDETVRLARRYGHRGVAGLVNALLRRLARERQSLPWPDHNQDPGLYLALRHSLPRWLAERARRRFGFSEAEAWCRANNDRPPLSIRPNRLRTTAGGLIGTLKDQAFEAVPSPLVPGMLRLLGAGQPSQTAAFRQGLFTVQGESSALVAPFLDPRPGETLVDLCSAPGGKCTHLAELTGDRGVVYALDLHPARSGLVEQAARRLGLNSIRPLVADGRLAGCLDLPAPAAVLVDAPCSALGVIRRLPEIKWRRRQEDFPALQALQLELLSAAAGLLGPGGRLLYSVCTNEPEETTAVIDAFSAANPGFYFEDLRSRLPGPLRQGQDDPRALSFYPHRHGLDGFFIALLRKK